jgi:hypothetical protein
MKTMKKPFFFLLTLWLFSVTAFAQKAGDSVVHKKVPHLTFRLQENHFYYSKGTESIKIKLETVDSNAVARLIDEAVFENKVKPKDLNVVIDGDDLLSHPQFALLLDTILQKTVSEVRLKTNVVE